jgi:hypothetical protein
LLPEYVRVVERLPGALAEVGEDKAATALFVTDIAAMEEAAEASLVHQESIVGVHDEARTRVGKESERGVLPVAEKYFGRDAIQLAGLHDATLVPLPL